MGRVERFRAARQLKRKYILAFLAFMLLVVLGICAADYSVNNLIKSEKHVGIFSVANVEDSYIECSFMGHKIFINTKFIKRDYQDLKKKILRFITRKYTSFYIDQESACSIS